MKKLILTVALCVASVAAFAQGTLNFANGGSGLVARVYTDSTMTTGLAGSAWSADLYWAPGVVANSTALQALGLPATFSTIGTQAGLFFGGPRTVPTAPGVFGITAQIRVWDTASGSSYASAVANATANTRVGESILFQVTLADPNAVPPGIPTTMTALNGNPWFVHAVIPEPSTLALAGLGLAGMMVLRRRK